MQKIRHKSMKKIKSVKSRRLAKKFDQWDSFKSVESTVRTTCKMDEEKMSRDFVIVNQQKVQYCVGIHDSFIDMNLKLFLSYLPAIRNSLVRMVSMKKTLYCSVCDAHKQQFFQVKDHEIIISKKFCRNILTEEVDYFMFMHVVYIEFIDQLLQYLACFETDAHVFSFPYPSFMSKYRRRIKIVKNCLASVGDEKNFYKNCYMICRQFSLTKFSSFFEGDMELFKRVNVSLHSFIRKFRRGEDIQNAKNLDLLKKFGIKDESNSELLKQISVPENVDGELLEPFGPHSGVTDKHYYFATDDRVAHFGSENTIKYSTMVDLHDVKEVAKYKKLLKNREVQKIKDEKMKIQEKQQEILNAENGVFVPPVKTKFKTPLSKPIIGPSGLVDRLSTRHFHSDLHPGYYPLRGDHKFTREHWKFKKHPAKYIPLKDEEKKQLEKEKKLAEERKKKAEEAKKAEAEKNAEQENKASPKTRKLKDTDPIVKTAVKDVVEDSKKKSKEELAKEKKKKEEEEKKKEEEEYIKNLKPNYEVDDQLKGDLQHKEYEDVISRPNDHLPWNQVPENDPEYEVYNVEPKNQIFEKSEAAMNIKKFVLEFEEEGIDPMLDLNHVNYQIDITTLISKRFSLSEPLNKEVLHLYLLANQKTVDDFNNQVFDLKIDDYNEINSQLEEVKDLKKVMAELVKDGDDPKRVSEINSQIKSIESEIAKSAAQKKMVNKMHAIKRQKDKGRNHDMNYNKHPHHHDHHDLYFNDSFNGIEHKFTSIFGS